MSKYKLVPVDPTPEMASEGARFLQIMSLPEREAVSVFRAMLAAAPQSIEPDEERLAMKAIMESVDPATTRMPL